MESQGERQKAINMQYLWEYIDYLQCHRYNYRPLAEFATKNHTSGITDILPFFALYIYDPFFDIENIATLNRLEDLYVSLITYKLWLKFRDTVNML